jgi:hypothetical protein
MTWRVTDFPVTGPPNLGPFEVYAKSDHFMNILGI